ncbi:MAG: hypothetical protein IPG04_36935 [Polyangiaceae bacterium]|nr:hypothetical protein [Polyangiaceae bacterium]
MAQHDPRFALELRARVFGVLGVSLAACAGSTTGDPRPDDTTTVTIAPPSGTNEVASAPLKSAGLPASAPRKAWRSAEGAYCVVLADAKPLEDDKAGTCSLAPPAKLHETEDPPAGMFGFTYDQGSTDAERKRVHDACCYRVIRPVRGRPLREQGGAREPIVAPLVRSGSWSVPIAVASARDAEERASSWARDAGLEHASAAEFCRLALGLLALGAPRELVDGALRASLSEVRHAALSYGVAAAYGGAQLGPGPLAIASAATLPDLVTLFEGTLADGCVGEALASLEAAAEAADSQDPALAAALREIAADEAGHAELAFRIAAWALDVASTSERAAMHGLIERARAELDDLDQAPSGSRLHAALLSRVRAEALEQVVRPALDVLEARAAA